MTQLYASFLTNLADEADQIALHYFSKRNLSVELKSDLTPVSAADLEIEQCIREAAARQFPDMGIVGEEFGGVYGETAIQLVVDPIDGTRNFVRGMPFFATLLAVSVSGQWVSSVVSAPCLQSRWTASQGEGSYLNGNRISVSSVCDLVQAQAFHGSLFGNEAATLPIDHVLNLLAKTARQRGVGDFYSHMLVAMGAGEFSLDFGLKPWDMAALKLIVEEAGGKATHVDGCFSLQKDSLICSNSQLHSEVLDFFR